MSAPTELKATLTLPQTAFAMKANLPQNEPLRLARWKELDLYKQVRKAAPFKTKGTYILHDGPPYANGPIHLGHALNKCLKDFVVKSRTMSGYDSPYVPGYDCHGLPIEIKVDEQLGRKKLEMPAAEVLEACRAYAQKYIDLQTSQFERIGCLGRWDNPYRTMSRPYEAKTLEAFYGFLEKGFVYRGLKPVYWCTHDRTALAEAEVEYENHTSDSVYVRYDLSSAAELIDQSLKGRKLSTIIWTTTPWTLPASMAVAFHPDFDYVAVAASNDKAAQVYILAAELAAKVNAECKLTPEGQQLVELARFKGRVLEHATFQHPFLKRQLLGVLADYVTADTGTGAVHTAPSHGADDFYTGVRYNIDKTCRVDAGGRLFVDPDAWIGSEPAPFEGKTVKAANPIIIEMLKASGHLLGHTPITHSYPHCWRCHKPVIFRATEQWFISLETAVKRADGSDTTYRQLAIEEIDKVVWDPSWGKERITNMIATRPDWCISRQRIWGVPIAVFLCEGCNNPIIDAELNKKVISLFEQEGAEAWHSDATDKLAPKNAVCSHCGGKIFRKETDILDVWFDSGTSWLAVCESDPELSGIYKDFQTGGPTQVLYLEGGDQHRGWFHSSLLTSVALRGRAPYSNVATAGWTLDEQGRAMSKSLGNGVDPVDIAQRLGGEIVRLWVASVDFREDMAASENLMQRCAELYRKLRNTFRFLLGNLHGFDPVRDRVAFDELLPLDKYMLARTSELTEKVLAWYEEFEFHRVYHAVNEFAVVDLSNFYLDVLKDRMYTLAPTSVARRSAQTVLWQIAETLVRLVAPILSFTADEVWEFLPVVEGREVSVHLASFPDPKVIYPESPIPILNEWRILRALRDVVLRTLEEYRQNKTIGKSLDADLHLYARGVMYDQFRDTTSYLKELFNVSKVFVTLAEGHLLDGLEQLANPPQGTEILTGIADLRAFIKEASGQKCSRCWNFMLDTANYGAWENLCGRCRSALEEMMIPPPTAEQIAAAAAEPKPAKKEAAK
jgi:isoleucyl-tRNA synthetase